MKKGSFIDIVLLWFSVYSNVKFTTGSLLWDNRFTNMISSHFVTSPDADNPALVLAVIDKSMNSIIANIPIVTNRMSANFNKFLFACPAESKQEEEINEKYSATKNALFIRRSYENPKNKETDKKKAEDMSEFDKKDSQFIEYSCKKPVQPSIKHLATNTENGLEIEFHLVGYEVYIKEQGKLQVLDYGNQAMGIDKDLFAWFNLLIIRYDRKGGNVLSVTCEMYNDRMNINAPSTMESLRNLPDDLWTDYFYKDYDIARTYSVGNQEKVFKELFNETPLLSEYFDKTQDRILVKVHLTPIDSFVHPVLGKAARTYGNIAPMWKHIRDNSWLKVESYVNRLVQGVYGVFVITGTYGTLSFYHNQKDVYLQTNENVKIPLAFWKIISYTKKSHQFHNILIVTYNNPRDRITPSPFCKVSECAELGWEYVAQNEPTIGYTICCKVTEDILNTLQISGRVKLDKVLNLKEMPHWYHDKLTLNVAQFILDQEHEHVDPTVRADNRKYRNQDILLEEEIKSKNKDEAGDEISITRILSVVADYISPFVPRAVSTFLPFFSNDEKNNAVVKNLAASARLIHLE